MAKMKKVEKLVREHLKAEKISVAEFARRMDVSRITIYNLFKGIFSRGLMKKIAREINVPAYLMMDAEDQTCKQDRDLLFRFHASEPRTQGAVKTLLGMTSTAPLRRRPVVLVVDDLKDNVDLLRRALRRDFEVKSFTDPNEALAYVKNQPVDAVITDQRMPGMTGTQMLIQMNELLCSAPKLMVSAYCDNEALLEAINVSRVDSFFVKPINPKQLRDRLNLLIQQTGSSSSVSHSVN